LSADWPTRSEALEKVVETARLIQAECSHDPNHPYDQGPSVGILIRLREALAALDALPLEPEGAELGPGLEALKTLKAKAKGFSDADYAHADQGGGIYFSAYHLRGSAAAYADMVTHIDQEIRALGQKREG